MKPPDGRRAAVRAFWEWVGVALAAGAVVVALALSGVTERRDDLIYDQFARLSTRAPSDRILIVAVDEASLKALGPWPWPRARQARLIDRLRRDGAAGVADDVLFVEPDPKGDPPLAAAMRRFGRAALPVLTAAPGENGRAVAVFPPSAPLARAAAALGHVDLPVDGDGVARRVSLAEATDGICHPHLTLALLQAADEGAKAEAAGADCPALAAASRGRADLLATPPRLIPFAGPPGWFRAAPAAEVLSGAVPPSLIQGRLVLIGATAAGLGDRHAVAVSGRQGPMAGVEIQANVLDAALRGISRVATPPWLLALTSLLPTALFMAALLSLRPAANPPAGLLLLIGVFATSALAFQLGVWWPPLPAAAGLLLAYPLWSWRRLSAASAYLAQEIARFDGGELPSPPGRPADILSRQVDALARAADQMRALSGQVRAALQSLPDAALLVDGEGRIGLANALAARLAGADRSEALQGVPLQRWLADALGEMEGAYVMDALTRGEGTVEARSRRGVDFEASQAALAGGGAEEAGAAGVILRLADVSPIRGALRQREEALQLLTHDIRAPVAAILTLAEERDEAAIGAHAARALALAEGYVQFARAETYRFDPVVFDLGQAALDAADAIWPQTRAKDVALATDAVGEDVLVAGDPSLIARAVINLLDNAVKVSPPGGTVTLAVRREGESAVCTVADEGPGVPEAERGRLFDAFNLGEGLRQGVSGAGLGLAIVHAAVTRHGGGVRVVDSPVGAVFEIRLPLAGGRDGLEAPPGEGDR